jgi:hypothetical protein
MHPLGKQKSVTSEAGWPFDGGIAASAKSQVREKKAPISTEAVVDVAEH